MSVFKKFKELNSEFVKLEKERYRMIDDEIVPLLEFGTKIIVKIDERELEPVTLYDVPRDKSFKAVVLDWEERSAEVFVSIRGSGWDNEIWVGFDNIIQIGWEETK